jgi:hypothetical protein
MLGTAILFRNSLIENLENFKYFETTVRNQICNHDELKIMLNPGHDCHHAIQNLLSSDLLSTTQG